MKRFRHFTPAWFAVIMGTGAISILFENFPYGSATTPMKTFSAIFFFLNLILFATFNVVSLFRYLMFPDIWSLMLRHPSQSLFLGCYPMGATTLINVSAGLFYKEYGFGGTGFLYGLWGLWWLDVAISVLCCWGLVHIMVVQHDHAIARMTPVWLLPVVTLIVASSTGGVLTPYLYAISPAHALLTATTCVLLVSIGLSLALMILTVYLYRLITHGPPPGANILSSFIPLGPTGQSGFAILLIGQAFKEILPYAHAGDSGILASEVAGDIIWTVCVGLSFVLWCLATMWLGIACLGLQHVLRKTRFPFKLPFWGMIFPNGVYANLTIQLGKTFDSSFFRVWGAIYAVITLLLWLYVFTRTMSLVRNGEIFEAPCVQEMDLSAPRDGKMPVMHSQDASGGSSTMMEDMGCRGSDGNVR
ncbi:uncharacterized protein STEHIDRAFT_66796 [Stereum hirsutum FP-91666 SS1]|uniref:uncharacterized protein n=1 Tax=Stereum hirsutum (strain FP-91666) TaxID=721885 RepID=UPI000444952F|nr:uncharacterized protein STEHIDRAFT_66796 [Stereum hirsutum FP-91666 SS1]EIM81137.1 hypothetical protein STEHIDRAFT_66796 [Stereum hirsutum FP-91666 SS1]